MAHAAMGSRELPILTSAFQQQVATHSREAVSGITSRGEELRQARSHREARLF